MRLCSSSVKPLSWTGHGYLFRMLSSVSLCVTTHQTGLFVPHGSRRQVPSFLLSTCRIWPCNIVFCSYLHHIFHLCACASIKALGPSDAGLWLIEVFVHVNVISAKPILSIHFDGKWKCPPVVPSGTKLVFPEVSDNFIIPISHFDGLLTHLISWFKRGSHQ